jgi:hypothetical protein
MKRDSRKSETGEPEARSKFLPSLNITAILMIGLLLLIAYQVYNGLMFKEIGFGEFSVKFAQPSPKTPETPDASAEFFLGRWQVEQQIAGLSGGSFIDYFKDGSFSGSQELFQGDTGRRVPVAGKWEFVKQAKDRFRLTLKFSDGRDWKGDFTIVNRDRVHNVYENYDAVRVPR